MPPVAAVPRPSHAPARSVMLACLAVTLALLGSPPAAAQQGALDGCYISYYDEKGIPHYSCENQHRMPAPPPEPDVWGALAVSPSTLAQGHSWNFPTEAQAAKRALAECQAQHVSDCRVVVTVADVCVSLAASEGDKVYAVGGPIGAANYADGNAMLKWQRAGGRSCAVVVSFCADGIRHVIGEPSGAPFGRRR
jgi:hypothetical protein